MTQPTTAPTPAGGDMSEAWDRLIQYLMGGLCLRRRPTHSPTPARPSSRPAL